MGFNVLLWIVQGLLAALFLFAGVMKLMLPIEAMAGPIALPGLFLRFLGVAEVLGAIGLILPSLLRIRPRLTPLAAAGLVIIMTGATAITVLGGAIPIRCRDWTSAVWTARRGKRKLLSARRLCWNQRRGRHETCRTRDMKADFPTIGPVCECLVYGRKRVLPRLRLRSELVDSATQLFLPRTGTRSARTTLPAARTARALAFGAQLRAAVLDYLQTISPNKAREVLSQQER